MSSQVEKAHTATTLVGDTGTLTKLPGGSSEVIATVTEVLAYSYAAAFKTVYLASSGFVSTALIGAALSKDPKRHLTDDVHRKLHEMDVTTWIMLSRLILRCVNGSN